MAKFNVRLKPSQCFFGISIEFLGREFDINGVRSFIGMENYFRDFGKSLSSHMIPLTALTKKRSTSELFKMTHDGRAASSHIKGFLTNLFEKVSCVH